MSRLPVRPHHFPDVITAIAWITTKATDAGNMPDMAKNPNAKLSVLIRCRDEIVRLRSQVQSDVAVIQHLQAENDRLKKAAP